MTRIKLFTGVAGAALMALAAGTAQAQSGGTANRTTQTTPSRPAATPSPAARQPRVDPNTFNAQYYLNNGDYTGASSIHAARITVGTDTYTDDGYTVRYHYNDPTIQEAGISHERAWQVYESYGVNVSDGAAALAQYGTPSNAPPGPQGSRTVSNYERAQTQLLESYQAQLGRNLQIAQDLTDRALYSSPDAQVEAARQQQRIQRDYNLVQSALQATRDYDGRSFPDQASAERYIAERSTPTYLLGRSDRTAEQQALLNSMTSYTAAGRADVRGDQAISASQRAEIEAIQHRIDVTSAAQTRNQRTATQDFGLESYFGYNPAQAARIASDRFGDTSVLPAAAGAARAAATGANAGRAGATGQNGGTAAGRAIADAAAGVGGPEARRPNASGGAAAGRAIADAAARANRPEVRSNPAGSGAAAAGRAAANGARGLDDTPTPSTAPRPVPVVEDNTPPRPVPTTPDYPTVSAEDRARISREAEARRQAERSQTAAAAETQRQTAAAAAREAAERRAMEERARINDENYRIFQAVLRQNAQDNRWAQMIRERFGNGAMDAFADGQVLTVLQLEEIYRDYDLDRSPVIPPARSLSSAGNSLSAAGRSLSAAGTAVVTGLDDYRDPAVQSFYEATRLLTAGRYDQQPASNAELADAVYSAGDYDVYSDPTGRWGRESGGYVLASLFSQEDQYLRYLTANGLTGLDSLLAQPFNVVLTWGAGAYDLDLHMTGPTGENQTDRFHIYYGAPGNLDGFPFAKLIKDCICNSGSEVVLTSALLRGGVYRVSVFDFGDQLATSTNLSNQSNAVLQIVRGGTAVSVGNGTTIEGGRTIASIAVPNGQFGNTWIAAELDPKNGRITVPRTIVQTNGDGNVR